MQNRRFRGPRIIGMIGMPTLPRNVAAAVRELVLVRDVMNFRAFGKRESRIVLREYLTKKSHRLKQLVR